MAHLATARSLVGEYGPPTLGVNTMVPAHKLAPTALVAALNVITRAGVLRQRPGYAPFGTGGLIGTPTGLTSYVQAAESGGRTLPVLATTSHVYAADNGVWTDLTGGATTGSDRTDLARFATLSIGTPLVNYLALADGVSPLRIWSGDLGGTFDTAIGVPDDRVFTDLCTISDRIVGIVPPYGVFWCNLRDLTAWPELNQMQRAETPDKVVALAAIGQGSFAVLYKQRSLWGINFNPGAVSEATAFTESFIGFWAGPAGPACVVPFDGGHVYMTKTGRVALFTGAQHAWLGDGVWPLVRAQINVREAGRSWGTYDPTTHEVHFVYPNKLDGDRMTGLLTVTLPMVQAGQTDTGVFPGGLASELTAGAVVSSDATNEDQVIVAGPNATDGTIASAFTLSTDHDTDNGTPFAGFWQTGLSFKSDPWRLEGVEIFADRGAGYGALQVRPVTSFSLSGSGLIGPAFIGGAGNLDTVDEPVRPVTGFDVRTRFIGLRCEFGRSDRVTVRYKGAAVYTMKPA
jgi:hypothetical protein